MAARRDIILHKAWSLLAEFVADAEDDENELMESIKVCTADLLLSAQKEKNSSDNYFEMIAPGMDDAEFRSHWRISRKTFEKLVKMLCPVLCRRGDTGRRALPCPKQCGMVLWLLANQESFKSIASRFDVSKSTLQLSLYKMLEALTDLAPEFITWPNQQKSQQIASAIENEHKVPGCVGLIGCCHISMATPSERAKAYLNCKGSHSVVLQGVCDDQLLFLDCFAGCPGSANDQTVFNNSPLKEKLVADGEQYLPNDTHLVGNTSFILETFLMTPFENNGLLSEAQSTYNTYLLEAQSKVVQAFHTLKNRFRRLRKLDMRRMDLIPSAITACCVLHNICIKYGDLYEGASDDDFSEEHINGKAWVHSLPNEAAILKRNHLVDLVNR